MKVTILGLGQKALKAIRALDQVSLTCIEMVIIGKDKNIQNDYSHDLETFCIQNKIRYLFRIEGKEILSKRLIAIGWRWMIHKNENQELIVFHDAILPKYRGFNPLVTALINGDREIGVTALFGESDFDRGDIICTQKFEIQYPIKIKEAIELISNGYATLLKDILQMEEIQAVPQVEKNASYSLWRDFTDYYIDWSWSADKIKKMVDAVGFPYLGARTRIENTDFIISEVTEKEDVLITNRTSGKVLFKEDKKPIVVCGKGLLRIDQMTNVENNETHFPKKIRIRFH